MPWWLVRAGEVATSPWAIAVFAIVGGLVGGRLIAATARPIFARLARRSTATWDDALVVAATTPFSLLVALQTLHVAVPWLALESRTRGLVLTGIALGTTAVSMWLAFRVVDVVRAALEVRSWAAERPATRSLLAIGARIMKVVIVVITAILILAYAGVSVASLIAGLGIGGLAVALAAQKTVENLFGTVSIGVDQPLREGDFVNVGDRVGTVEAIGLRSTRIRTLDRTLLTIPNGQLADLQIESYSVRDRMRLACTLRLVYETTADRLRKTLADLEATLRAHPKIWPDAVVVRFSAFGESSLDIEIMAWFQTPEWSEFQLIRQEVLLQFKEVVERNQTAFAVPTRTVHVTRS